MSKIKTVKETNIIEKSNPLIYMKGENFSKNEYLLFDTYLSLIDPRNEDDRTATFLKKDFEKVLGIKQLRKEDLEKCLSNLMKTTVEVKEPNLNMWVEMNLFSHCKYRKDEDGQFVISITCNSDAKDYIFNIKRLGYVKYQLKDIAKLPNRNAINLFLYGLNNSFKKTWEIAFTELKKQFNCDKDYYDDFKRFKEKILDPAIKSVNEITNLNISYERIYGERNKTIGIRFTATLSPEYKKLNENCLESFLDNTFNKDSDIYSNTDTNNDNENKEKLLKDKIKHIQDMIDVDVNGANNIIKTAETYGLSDNELFKRLDYVVYSKTDIRNVVGYTISLLDNSKWSEIKSKPSYNEWCDFKQSTSDKTLDEIEKMLIKKVNKAM